ncbi:MAG: OOP family OmpA-OmpF porin [Candidatus Krumholzibacteriia bacterium]|jgi:OOP family OmpA-OmpF porin
MRLACLLAYLVSLIFATSVGAQNNPFDPGWVLESEASSLKFQSVKNQSKVESSSFATITGTIEPNGAASVKILLDSVDTKVDLRNVRMRFMFFETFQYPEATITLQISPADIADLAQVRRKVVRLPYTINLHGVTKTLEADLALTLISDDLVAISTNEPITLSVADFDLTEGIEKLQEAANVEIIPSSTITFDFIFKRLSLQNGTISTATATPEKPANAALESEGDFSLEACIGRFEILSRSGNIYFSPGSARLDRKSGPLLDTVVDIAGRCPGLVIQVGGHTDSLGAEEANQRLSDRRAKSVASYLTDNGIEPARVLSVGFGEKRPVADNETEKGRSRNRRIEFSAGNN